MQHQVLFSVPKKKVKHAVARNAIKRKMREAYRMHKHLLTAITSKPLLIGYIYISSQTSTTFETIEKQVVKGIHQLVIRCNAV